MGGRERGRDGAGGEGERGEGVVRVHGGHEGGVLRGQAGEQPRQQVLVEYLDVVLTQTTPAGKQANSSLSPLAR